MRIGIVDDVEISRRDHRVYVSVALGVRSYKDGIEYWQPGAGIYIIPSEGDAVRVIEVGEGRSVAINARVSGRADIPPGASEGDIYINTDADIYVGDPENATAVADANHTHDFSGTDSSGDSFSGTTTGPSSTTETQIE